MFTDVSSGFVLFRLRFLSSIFLHDSWAWFKSFWVCLCGISVFHFLPSFLCIHFLYVHICLCLSINVCVVHFPSVHTCMCVFLLSFPCVFVYMCVGGMSFAGIVGGGSLWSQQYPGGGEGTKGQCQCAGPDAFSGRGSAIPVNKSCFAYFIYAFYFIYSPSCCKKMLFLL